MSKRHLLSTALSAPKLRWLLLTCFVILALPLTLLIVKTQAQIKWEALFQQRTLAEELSKRIDLSLTELIQREDARPIADYQFLLMGSQTNYGYLQRSPLSEWPVTDAPPGLIGYFQISDSAALETPLLPNNADYQRWELSEAELNERRDRKQQLINILSQNQLTQKPSVANKKSPPDLAEEFGAPATSDMLADEAESAEGMRQNLAQLDALQARATQQNTLGKLEELKLDKSLEKTRSGKDKVVSEKSKAESGASLALKRSPRKEQVAVPASASAPAMQRSTPTPPSTPIRMFESEVDPMQWVRLDSGHLLFYRKVWRNGERLVQGFLLDEIAFFNQQFETLFRQSSLATFCDLVLAYRGDVVKIYSGTPTSGDYGRLGLSSARDVQGTLILQQRLSTPFSDLQVVFSANTLPTGPGGALIYQIGILLFSLLLVIFIVLYRLGLRQLKLAQQQQNFIASVSHELKTPLTSIRMFGEMLREGWAPPAKQKEYYDYICDESERLSRLITNVLQLARMERHELKLDIKPYSLSVLSDLIRSRIHSQVERTGFELQFNSPQNSEELQLAVDADALIQILLNLVDNAIKFSKDAQQKKIDVHIAVDTNTVSFCVRDYGPGIPPGQQQKIFELFYRIGDELTRETQGTGIGLALVQQLAHAITGTIQVRNVQPGAEFKLTLPVIQNTR